MDEITAGADIVIVRRLKTFVEIIFKSQRCPYFRFVRDHSHLGDNDKSAIRKSDGLEGPKIVSEFESAFDEIDGDGRIVSCAAGRIGFFDLMLCLGVGLSDEVSLFVTTCEVIPNAVLRTGADALFNYTIRKTVPR